MPLAFQETVGKPFDFCGKHDLCLGLTSEMQSAKTEMKENSGTCSISAIKCVRSFGGNLIASG